jgi:c-di-GMP-binding flagellar brake protein YcgR
MGKSPKQVFLLMQALIKQWYNRGQRQYIRVRCPANGRARFNLRSDGDIYQGHVLDISSAGMACEFDGGMVPPRLRKGSILSKIQLQLNSRLILVDGVVMGSRVDGSGQRPHLWVIVFRNHSDTGAIQKIKDYVREQLQFEFNEQLKYG